MTLPAFEKLTSTTIAGLGRVVTGRTPSSKNPHHFGTEYPFITPTDIDGIHRSVQTERGLSEEGKQHLSRIVLPVGSTCFVCIGATIGKVCLTDKPSVTNQQINSVIVDQEKHDSVFVYYLLTTLKELVKAKAGGAATPIVNKSIFEEIPVILPPLETQREIAGILGAYDDLIENNRRRIAILEEMARNLYKEWFVHFRFPGHENVKLVETEHGKIPEGWEWKLVEELLQRVQSGKKYSQRTAKDSGNVPILDQGRSGIIGYHNEDAGVKASEENPIIVFANHTCYQRLIHFPFSTIQNVLPFLPSKYCERSIFWLHYATKDIISFNDYKGHWPEFISKRVLVPPRDLAIVFAEHVEPIELMIYKLNTKNNLLVKTRDMLLQRLMSPKNELLEVRP
ncbi:MAG: restriction endonuclease subunit S [Candidatus Sumerlaeia bacterium]|nr:restriction endonuclease subunit S [Candidatus Sumerlaeia bacterium]